MIKTENTPNPDTLKFLPGKKVSEIGPLEFLKDDKNTKIPLVNKILSVEGTTMVFLGEDFITVKKEKKLDWENLKYNIISEINDYYLKGNNVVVSEEVHKRPETEAIGPSNEVVNKINEVLNAKVRPAVARDGGDITFQSFDNGIVYLQMKGACSGCPSSALTLKAGIEKTLKHYIPEVLEVQQVT